MLLMLAFCVHVNCLSQWTLLNAYSSEDIQSHAQSQLSLDALTSSLFTYDVEMRRLSYDMPFLGADPPVSGAAFLPNSAGTDFPVLVYHHGTTFQRQSAPSFKVDLTNLGYAMASMGFVVLMPDYAGLGESAIQHPYCHAQSEADAGWSMVEAVVELDAGLDVGFNGNLYITGYSQGGHGAMAMARAQLPESLQDVLAVKAVAPLSGPYDMSGTQLPWILGDPFYTQPAYIFYILKGWNEVYGSLFESFADICQEPYAAMLDTMLNGEHSGTAINALCPEDWTTMLLPGVMDTMTTANSTLLDVAAQNDVHNWTPAMPLHMRYCTEDEEVWFQNAVSAYDWMSAAAAPDVEAFNLGGFNHNDCALSAITTSVLWFLSLESSAAALNEYLWSPECLEWEHVDIAGRKVHEADMASASVGWMLRRCVQTGRVEKCWSFQ